MALFGEQRAQRTPLAAGADRGDLELGRRLGPRGVRRQRGQSERQSAQRKPEKVATIGRDCIRHDRLPESKNTASDASPASRLPAIHDHISGRRCESVAVAYSPYLTRYNDLELDVGRADDLAPLLGFVGDDLAEVGGRTGNQRAAEVGQPNLQFGIGEAGIGLLVQPVDDLGGRFPPRAAAGPPPRPISPHEFPPRPHPRKRPPPARPRDGPPPPPSAPRAL